MPLLDKLKTMYDLRRAGAGKRIRLQDWFTDRQLPSSQAQQLHNDASEDLGRLTFGHSGRMVHKWTHYPAIYERYFAPYRGKPIRMLEIGVSHGGSLEIWRAYFGPEATIFGVDINPACATRFDAPNQVRIGSQADPEFLRSVVAEMGGVDIVLDDGSHVSEHQSVSFRTLFPLLSPGGLYAIEDLHTAYWRGEFHGGYKRAGTGIEIVKEMIDDLHAWYHDEPERRLPKEDVLGIHVHDSIAFIEKGAKTEPKHVMVGNHQPG